MTQCLGLHHETRHVFENIKNIFRVEKGLLTLSSLFNLPLDCLFFISHLFCSKANKTCGGMMTDRSGLITAPDFDADGYYDFNVACEWLIKVAGNSAIAYQVVNMEIGAAATAGCKGDVLRVSTSGTRFCF